jgi:aspartyl-tRNA synthetase
VEAQEKLPFTVSDVMVKEDEDDYHVNTRRKPYQGFPFILSFKGVRLDNRVIDMRAPAHLAIWKIQSGVQYLFREFLYHAEFTEIHTPKMTSYGSSEYRHSFDISYFNKKEYLSQSTLIYRQLAIQGGLKKVFEIGPVL